MKAIVFAAGLGTRLGEFTKHHPKALVEIHGRAMLGRVLEKLRDAGVDEAVVNVYHFAEQIEKYLKDCGDFGMDIRVSRETEFLLETGGGLLAARKWLDTEDSFFIHNADILTDFPLEEMLGSHVESGADATVLVAERKTSRYLVFTEQGQMKAWKNVDTGVVRPAGASDTGVLRAFGGVHVFSGGMFDGLQAYNDTLRAGGCEHDSRGLCRFSIMDFYINTCAGRSYRAYEPSKPYRWCDIGKPDSLQLAESLFV